LKLRLVLVLLTAYQTVLGQTTGFGSVWAPICRQTPSLLRVRASTSEVQTTLTVGPPSPEGGIDAKTNKVVRQWLGRGGDSLRLGYDSVWLTDCRHDLLWRFNLGTAQILIH